VYLRPAFVQDDPEAIRALIHGYPFAQIVTTGPRGIEASHLPIMSMPEGDGFVLAGHFAAGNPQCDAIGRGDDALVIFSGPHAYISPAWYEVQPSVPTWDFAAVHVYGALEPVTDLAAIAADVDVMAGMDPAGFDVMALPPEYRSRMFAGIRAFRMRPVRVEAQWKMSQNRGVADRRRVMAALQAQGDAAAVDVARMIEATLPAPVEAAS
jgi:transcriptional regulator